MNLTTCNTIISSIIRRSFTPWPDFITSSTDSCATEELSLLSHSASLAASHQLKLEVQQQQQQQGQGKIMGRINPSKQGAIGASMLLQAFFITTLMPSCATALILNYTTRGCSKHCESINCDNPHTIRFGKFCGVGYTGCPNQSPCDRLDACCRQHDFCVGTNPANFPNQTCRYNLRSCLQQYLSTGAAVYHGSNCTAMAVQNTVMVAMESTTYQHVSPRSAPQAGGATDSVSAKLLECITALVFSCGLNVSVLLAHDILSYVRN